MFEDLFRSGTLEMAAFPLDINGGAALWSSYTANRIFVVVAVFVVLLNLPNLFSIGGALVECLKRGRGNIALQHSVSSARARNLSAVAAVLPMCILADRFKLYEPDFVSRVPDGVSIIVILGVVVGYALLRRLFFTFIKPYRVSQETALAAHYTAYNMFIIYICVAVASFVAAFIIGIGDNALRGILLGEMALLYGCVLIRFVQILAFNCSGITTFLYLCGLELAPTSMLVASALIL